MVANASGSKVERVKEEHVSAVPGTVAADGPVIALVNLSGGFFDVVLVL